MTSDHVSSIIIASAIQCQVAGQAKWHFSRNLHNIAFQALTNRPAVSHNILEFCARAPARGAELGPGSQQVEGSHRKQMFARQK